MQWRHSVRLEDAPAAVEEAIQTLETTVEWCCLAAPTRAAGIESVVAWAIESDHFIKHSRPYVQPSFHLSLESCQYKKIIHLTECNVHYRSFSSVASLLLWEGLRSPPQLLRGCQ